MKICTFCGYNNPDAINQCLNCRSSLGETPQQGAVPEQPEIQQEQVENTHANQCPQCGTFNPPFQQFCMRCNTNLPDTQVQPGVPAQTPEQQGQSRFNSRHCNYCGYDNPDVTTYCLECGRELPRLQNVNTVIPANPGGSSGKNFFIGLLLGSIPLVIWMISLGSIVNQDLSWLAVGIVIAPFCLLIAVIIAIVFCFINGLRSIGIGMLVAAFISPVIGFTSCLVALSHSYQPIL